MQEGARKARTLHCLSMTNNSDKRMAEKDLTDDPDQVCADMALRFTEVLSNGTNKCDFCLKISSVNLKKCSRCKLVAYCNCDCQRSHWPQHKVICDGYYDRMVSNIALSPNKPSKQHFIKNFVRLIFRKKIVNIGIRERTEEEEKSNKANRVARREGKGAKEMLDWWTAQGTVTPGKPGKVFLLYFLVNMKYKFYLLQFRREFQSIFTLRKMQNLFSLLVLQTQVLANLAIINLKRNIKYIMMI